MRDFVHVADLAVGHVKALSYLMDGGAPIALNLGGGAGTTVNEIIDSHRTRRGCAPRSQRRAAAGGRSRCTRRLRRPRRCGAELESEPLGS